MKRLLFTVVFLLYTLLYTGLTYAYVVEEALTVNGQVRTYTLAAPDTPARTPRPLVMFFHGGSGVKDWVEKSGLLPLVDERRWHIVYPQAQDWTNNAWESGSWGVGGSTPFMGFNDFDLVEALIADLTSRFNIDSTRIFAMGHSNGGMFVNRLACQRDYLFRGVVSSGGSRTVPADQEGCSPRPLSMLVINGTADGSSPYDCPSRDCLTRGGPVIGAIQTAEDWASINGCGVLRSTTWPVVGPHQVNQHQYRRCNASTTLLEVVGMGHSWPPELTETNLNAEWLRNWLIAKSR